MYWLNSVTHRKIRTGGISAWVAIMLLAATSATAQFPNPSLSRRSQASASAAANDLEARRALALDAAVIAARGKLFDLSVEAMKRATEQPIVIARPDFQSSLLGGGQPSGSVSFGNPASVAPEPAGQTELRQKLELLVDVWKEMEAPPEKIAAALQGVVLPGGKGQLIQMFAPRSGNSGYRSNAFDFSAKPAALARVLGFEVVDWAHAAGQLDALVAALEKRIDEPAVQTAASALLIYAHRVAGRPEAATKSLESMLAKQSGYQGGSNLVIVALTHSLPKDVDAAALDESTIADFVLRLMQSDPDSEEVRSYVLQRLSHAIEQGDHATVKRYADAIESAIDQLNVNQQEYKMQVKKSFWSSAEREAIRHGHVDLIIDFVVRQNIGDQLIYRFNGSDEDRLMAFAKGTSQQRMERARRLLLEIPLANPNQLNIATFFQTTTPAFLSSGDKLTELLPHLTPFQGASTISLLDMLLNEAEARGETEPIVDQLFKNASDREDVIKLIAQWMMLRAEKRGKNVDEKIAGLGRFASEQEFVDWIKRMPPAAATELLSQHIAGRPLSDELVELYDNRPSNAPGIFSGIGHVDNFVEKYYQRKNPSAPPLRSFTELKHWRTASLNQVAEPDSYQSVLEIPSPSGKQGLGHQRGIVMLRYPLSGEFTIQGTFKTSPSRMMALGVHGFMVRLSNTASVLFRQRFGDSRPSIPLGDSNLIAWNLSKDALTLSVDGEVKRKWRPTAEGAAFVSLSNDQFVGAIPEDFTIKGQIPREVALVNRGLIGWNSQVFYHALPSVERAFEDIQVGDAQDNRFVNRATDGPGLIWREENGEISVGRDPDDKANQAPSQIGGTVYSNAGLLGAVIASPGTEGPKVHQTEIHYDRPLLEGERIEFELFHNSKAQTAAPVTGRLAYCLEGEKVLLHWIVTEFERKRLNITEENRVDDPAGEQLAPLKLEDNAWNRLAMRIESGNVILSVADQDIYRRPLAKDESTLFGFFADPSAPVARIRNVVLKGDWPSELPKDLWELVD